MPPAPQRAIPSVDRLLRAVAPTSLPRPLVVRTIRRILDGFRRSDAIPSPDAIVADLDRALATLARRRLQPVVNGTGVLVHTNLGRSPLSPAAVDALVGVASGYSNLEFDLESGDRGSRGVYVKDAIALATGAEAATVVNNGAAALVLVLRHFTSGPHKEVVISRGELVQIGGGFRIPEILESSGARLREIGTTNQTTLDDYARALSPETALVLRVHRSNFFMDGFVGAPSTAELAALLAERGPDLGIPRPPLVEDQGSGAWVDLAPTAGVPEEILPQRALADGADLVCFSGDKLLGGPQAGILLGRSNTIAALEKSPLFRAFRCDKLVLAALQATVEAYLLEGVLDRSDHPSHPPVLALANRPVESLRSRADTLADHLRPLPANIRPEAGRSRIGGGGHPRAEIPSVVLAIRPHRLSVDALAARLRKHVPPVVGCVSNDAFRIDLRTVLPSQDDRLVEALTAALAPP